MGEYLEYVSDVAGREGLEAARLRSPRRSTDAATSPYLLDDGAGGLKLPEVDAEGHRWDARMPAFGITCHDIAAYCGWRSERDGREYRLPSEEEWEKSARGVDGRWFPWGWRFDASLCNMRESRNGRPSHGPVEEFPRDVSVYGVRDLAGNVRNWTAGEESRGTGATQHVDRVFRGGYWACTARYCRSAQRYCDDPAGVFMDIGFRLARSRSR